MINLLLKSLQQEAAVAAHPSLRPWHGVASRAWRSLRVLADLPAKKFAQSPERLRQENRGSRSELVQAVLPTARNGAAEHGSNAGVYNSWDTSSWAVSIVTVCVDVPCASGASKSTTGSATSNNGAMRLRQAGMAIFIEVTVIATIALCNMRASSANDSLFF
jgi:hypothetical protein